MGENMLFRKQDLLDVLLISYFENFKIEKNTARSASDSTPSSIYFQIFQIFQFCLPDGAQRASLSPSHQLSSLPNSIMNSFTCFQLLMFLIQHIHNINHNTFFRELLKSALLRLETLSRNSLSMPLMEMLQPFTLEPALQTNVQELIILLPIKMFL